MFVIITISFGYFVLRFLQEILKNRVDFHTDGRMMDDDSLGEASV